MSNSHKRLVFDLAWRGYHTTQVDEAIQRLEREFQHAIAERDAAVPSELATQLSGLREEIAALRSKAVSPGPATTMSEHITAMLRLAEEEADSIRHAAHEQAREVQQAAEKVMAEAQARADELVTRAEERIAQLDADARACRARIQEDFELALRARRAEAARREDERVQVLTTTAEQLMAASGVAAKAAATVKALLSRRM